MGNTKSISFEGTFTEPISREWIRDKITATYLCVECRKGEYLEEEDEATEGKFYCLGAIHSYSMSGFRIVPLLIEAMESGHVLAWDLDFPDITLTIKNSDEDIRKIKLGEIV